MQHCTNCGAAAREGAKFCTSCGVRLEPSVTVDESPRDESQETATHYTASSETAVEAEAPTQENVPPGTAAVEDEEATYRNSWPDADPAPSGVEGEGEQPAATVAPSDGGTSGGPAPETPATAEETEPEDTLAGWGSAGTETPTEADTDDGPVWDTAGDEETAPEEPRSDAGASEWEGWSPTPASESAVHHHDDDGTLRDIRELVDALQRRLDRLADPAPMSARGVDADELAEQLDGWASEGPNSDELLWVIRDARANPRDIDAVARLADRAEELERLVERYGAICTDAQRWVARLRYHNQPDA